MAINFTDIKLVRDAGGTYTPEYDALHEKRGYSSKITSARDRFVEAVLTDAPDDELTTWHALAVAEEASIPAHVATVRNATWKALDRLIAVEIDKTAADNLAHVTRQFNDAASKFTKAHAIVPATTDPAELALASEKIRKAWAAGQSEAATMNALVPVLLAAHRLNGNTVDNKDGIAVTIDATGLHRRRVWEAWATDNRWTALVELGATLHASTEYQPYREPRPIEQKRERGRYGITLVAHDPEDAHVGA